jgi:hypothetical protein
MLGPEAMAKSTVHGCSSSASNRHGLGVAVHSPFPMETPAPDTCARGDASKSCPVPTGRAPQPFEPTSAASSNFTAALRRGAAVIEALLSRCRTVSGSVLQSRAALAVRLTVPTNKNVSNTDANVITRATSVNDFRFFLAYCLDSVHKRRRAARTNAAQARLNTDFRI